MKARHKRAAIIVGAIASLGAATALVLNALDSNIALYITPSEVVAGKAPQGKAFRMGGMVKVGSIQRNGLNSNFIVTDTAKDIPVAYTGILPDLFTEGKGAVVQGKLGADGLFVASEVLAKHDENYMPPEAKHAIDQAQRAAAANAAPTAPATPQESTQTPASGASPATAPATQAPAAKP